MFLSGYGDFTGREKRTSKNGNEYELLRFIGSDKSGIGSGEQFVFYCSKSLNTDVSVDSLVKYKQYFLEFDYHYNNFQNRYQLDLLNIKQAK